MFIFSGTIQCIPNRKLSGITTCVFYAMDLFPENMIQVNRIDAKNIGVKDGDIVLLHSASNIDDVKGKVEVTECIRLGCERLRQTA